MMSLSRSVSDRGRGGIARLVVGLFAGLFFAAQASAQVDFTAFNNLVTAQTPDERLRFNGDFSNSGAVGSAFASNGGGFGPDVTSAASSAYQLTADTHGVSTSTDVISNPTGAVSFLFQAPSVGFERDRYLFDGGSDDGDFADGEDDGFQALWNNTDSSIDVVVGNSTLSIPSSNIEATPGAWYYLGVTWDEDQNNNTVGEVQAVFGQVGAGGTASISPQNIANNDSSIGDGLSFYIGNRGADGAAAGDRGAFGSDAWVGPAGEAGSIDEFAIWNRRIEATELVAQFNALNSISPGPAAPANAIVFDGFDDGNRNSQINGIDWYNIDNNIDRVSLVDDSAGTNAIGAGTALALDASGNPRTQFQGVFDQQVELGSETGATLRVSFDARFERTIDTMVPVVDENGDPVLGDDGMQLMETVAVSAPVGEADAELRFGLYADSDGEFGQVDNQGNVWGSSDGGFSRGSEDGMPLIGVTQDNGVYATISFAGDNNTRVRVQETVNQANSFGGGSGGNNGTTQDLVLGRDEMNGADGAFIDSELVHNISLELTRLGEGDQIQVTVTIDDGGDVGEDGDAQVFTFSGLDSDDPDNMLHLPGDGISGDLATQTIFDYFTADLSARGEDITWVFDNFAIEAFIAELTPTGDANGDGIVNAADYVVIRDGASDFTVTEFAANFETGGGGNTTASATAVPEPAGLAMLLLGLAAGVARSRRR